MKLKKNRKLKGSVLLTVVSVMALLIIFMASTLTLAAAANNRAHANYSDSQAEYTARAAIEGFTQALEDNDAVAQTLVSMAATDKVYPAVVINDPGMGSVGYYEGDTWVEDRIKVECLDENYSFDEKQNAWVPMQVIKISATGKVGKEEKNISYYIQRTTRKVKSANIRGFQTLGDGGLQNNGAFTGALSLGLKIPAGLPTQTFYADNDFELHADTLFVNGNFDTSIGNGCDLYISESDNGNPCQSSILGDLILSNAGLKVHLDYPYARKTSAGSWNETEMTFNNIPYLFVQGDIKGSTPRADLEVYAEGENNGITNSADDPFNVMCNHINLHHVKLNGTDVFLFGASGESVLGSNGDDSNLYRWSSSVLNKTADRVPGGTVGGSIYCNHNLKLEKSLDVKGNLVVQGNLDLSAGNCGNVNVGGDLVVNGSISGFNKLHVKGKIYCHETSSSVGGLADGIYVKRNSKNDSTVKSGYVKANNIPVRSVYIPNESTESIQIRSFVSYKVTYNDNTSAEKSIQFGTVKEANEPYPTYEEKTLYQYNGQYNQAYDPNDPSGTPIQIKNFGSEINWSYSPAPVNGHFYVISDDPNYNGVYSSKPYINRTTNTITDKSAQVYYTIEVPGASEEDAPIVYQSGDFEDVIKQAEGANVARIENIKLSMANIEVNSAGELVKATPDLSKSGDPNNFFQNQGGRIYTMYVVDPDGKIVTDDSGNAIRTESDWEYWHVDSEGNLKTDAEGNYIRAVSSEGEPISAYEYILDADGKVTDEAAAPGTHYFYEVDYNGETTSNRVTNDVTYWYNNGGTWEKTTAAAAQNTDTNMYRAWYDPTKLVAEEFYYYDGDPTGHDEAWHNAHKVSEAVAFAKRTYADPKSYAEMINGAGSTSVYPSKMTRAALQTGENKMVLSLKDARESVGMDASGNFSESDGFYKDVPDPTAAASWPTYTNDNVPSVITQSCILTGTFRGKTIKVNPNGATGRDFWVVLDGATFNNQGSLSTQNGLVCSSNGTVNILVKNTVTFDNAGIYTEGLYNKLKAGDSAANPIYINEADQMNIYLYGAEDSKISMANDKLICANCKAPYTLLECSTASPPTHYYKYVEKSGTIYDYGTGNTKVGLIGSALFKGATVPNNFAILFTESNENSNGIHNSNVAGADWYAKYYDSH